MRQDGSLTGLIFVVIVGVGGAVAFGLHNASSDMAAILALACSLVLAYCGFRNQGCRPMEQGSGAASR